MRPRSRKMAFVRTLYSPVLNNRRGVLMKGGGGGQKGDLNINKSDTQGIFKYMYLKPP